MSENILMLTVNGIDYSGWKTIEIDRDMEEMSGGFTLEMVDLKDKDAVPLIRMGDECLVSIKTIPEDETFLLMTGYVDSVLTTLGKGGIKFTVTGRDRTADLVDCSVTKASEWKNEKFENFVRDVIEPFSLEVVLDEAIDTGDEIKIITPEQGETVAQVIAKYAQEKQLIVYTLPDGRLIITRASTERIQEGIGPVQMLSFVEGENILKASASGDWSQVYSEYRGKGSRQSTGDDSNETDATQIQTIIKDGRVTRFRPLIVIPENEQKDITLKIRMEWEATVRMGRAEGYSITRQGWQVEINKLAFLDLKFVGFRGDMVLKSYRLTADEQGKRTEFKFVHPRAFAVLEADTIELDFKDFPFIDFPKISRGILTGLAILSR